MDYKMTTDPNREIIDKLSDIQNTVTELACHTNATNEMCLHHQKWLEDHERELGGSAGVSGMRTQIQELKTAQDSQKWYWRAAIAAFIGNLIAQITEFFHIGGSK